MIFFSKFLMKFLPSFFQTNSIILVEEETIVDLLLSYYVWKISSSQFFSHIIVKNKWIIVKWQTNHSLLTCCNM